MGHADVAAVTTSLIVERWDADQVTYVAGKTGMRYRPHVHYGFTPETFRRFGVEPYWITRDDNCNMIVQAGWVALLGGIAGTSIATKFSATAGRIGIGTSTTAATYSDVKLTGDTGGASTTSYYKLVSSAPVIVTVSSPPTLTFTATFGTSVGNFAWNEFGADNGAADSVTTTGTFINHGISPQGTKPSGQVWTATMILTFGVPVAAGAVS